MKPVGLCVILNLLTPNPLAPLPFAFDVNTALVCTSNIRDLENRWMQAAAIGLGK